MVNENQSSYRSIFKATSLFGGVQLYQIITQIIKSKFIAVLLGPAGLGILGLYQSAIDLVKSMTNMGLAQSAVRDVSEANAIGNFNRIAKTVTVLRRLVWITGVLGVFAVAFFSPVLSKTTFGNYDYTIPFIILSVTLLFEQLSAGQKVILQGMRRLKDLAKATAFGSTFGLIVSIPLYYLFGIKGIVPTLVLNSTAALIISWRYSRKVKIEKVEVTNKQTFEHGKQMLVMGVSMSASGIMTMVVAYFIRVFIQSEGGIEDVGYYQAGYAIMSSYVGMIFSAISTDYYPRLAAVNKDNNKCQNIVCQQGEIATMIMGLILTVCITFTPLLLRLLFSDKFAQVNEFILFACFGMMFKLSSWLIAFQFVAKAESKLFIINEFISNLSYLLFSIIGYKLYGITGLGLAFMIQYFVYFVQVYIIAHFRYGFRFTKSFRQVYILYIVLVAICLVVALICDAVSKYVICTIIIMISSYFSIKGLNNRLSYSIFIKQIFRKK